MTSLSISATGTAYLQNCISAGVMPGQLPTDTDTQGITSTPAATGSQISADAISASTRAKIDAAQKLLDDGMKDFLVRPDTDVLGKVIDMLA